ncbi:phytanoyl-CoA dioxygenase family protein [Alphaproteobacteria bacterium]|nr:phytanoyl-CoA dioxygenase family protein [Alphaproteobacteria bacterium]
MVRHVKEAIENSPGFWTGPLLSKEELADFKRIIFKQLIRRIKEVAPDHVDAFLEVGLEGYHTVSHLFDHASAWPRSAREFDTGAIEFVEQSELLQNLRQEFGGGEITNEAYGIGPEIVWRIVRPHEKTDVQSFHADSWFWDINNLPYPQNRNCVKIWILLQGTEKKSGLRVVPNSHLRRDWEYKIVDLHGYKKPLFDEYAAGLDPILLETTAGDGVIFSYNLLHGGALTTGEMSRISVEFTLSTPIVSL